MNTASLEVCKTLYELSGWEVTLWYQRSYYEAMQDWTEWKITEYESELKHERVPAYDLGYLLRKLPDGTTVKHYSTREVSGWVAEYFWIDENGTKQGNGCGAAIPENAACELAIQLFKAGILTKGDK